MTAARGPFAAASSPPCDDAEPPKSVFLSSADEDDDEDEDNDEDEEDAYERVSLYATSLSKPNGVEKSPASKYALSDASNWRIGVASGACTSARPLATAAAEPVTGTMELPEVDAATGATPEVPLSMAE